MSNHNEEGPQAETRAECPIVRTHRRFLLRRLEFTQQYAPMYRSRMAAQQDRALAAVQRIVAAEDGDEGGAMPSDTLRVLEMQPNTPAFSVGVVYKQMKLLPRFLDEYQRELVRIDAGDDDGEGDDEAMEDAEAADVAAAEAAATDSTAGGALEATGQARAAADERYSICHAQDVLMLEDSSGRVTLQGLDPTRLCTGVVIGIYGTLSPSGLVEVHRYAFASIAETYVPRPLPAPAAREPCYVAFVCGLNVGLSEVAAAAAEEGAACPVLMTAEAVVRHRALLELLVDFICGTTADTALLAQSRRISRLVVGGNSIAPTDELRLKKKVKLDPSDHVRLNDDKANAGVVTSARLMQELDGVLERLAAAVEVELMPGDNDMSDAFQPQQPLHPVLLPNAARYSTLRLVSNPFEFTASPDGVKKEEEEEKKTVSGAGARSNGKGATYPHHGTGFFVTSGQNVNDVARETQFSSHLAAMSMILASGCACPTAPNTLFSYPFRDEDPFLFTRTPHCFVACDQPQFQTRYIALDDLEKESASFLAPSSVAGDGNGASAAQPPRKLVRSEKDGAASRIVCVPSFARSGSLVLVDVNSPTLETTRVVFAAHGGVEGAPQS